MSKGGRCRGGGGGGGGEYVDSLEYRAADLLMVVWVYFDKTKVVTLLAVCSLANNVFLIARPVHLCLCFCGVHDGGWRTGV